MRIHSTAGRLIAENPAELEQIERLAYLALLAAIEAPAKRGPGIFSCGIRWDLIGDLRAQLEGAGVNWRAGSRAYRRRLKIERLTSKIEALEALGDRRAAGHDQRLEKLRADLAKLEAGKA